MNGAYLGDAHCPVPITLDVVERAVEGLFVSCG
jgi:hypothetical protein